MFYGTKWKAIRLHRGIRQRDLSKLTGFTQGQISKFESGETDSAVLAAVYMFYASDEERIEIVKELVNYAEKREQENRKAWHLKKKSIANDASGISEAEYGTAQGSRSADAERGRSTSRPL